MSKSTKIRFKKYVLTCLKEGGCTYAEKVDFMELTRGLLCEQNKEGVCVRPH